MLNFDFFWKGLGLVSPPHFLYDFSRKWFLMLCSINPKTAGGLNWRPPPFRFFQNCIFYREGKTLLFWTFNIIIRPIFPETFTEFLQVVWKMWRFSLSILTIFIKLFDLLTFHHANKLMMSAYNKIMSAFSPST